MAQVSSYPKIDSMQLNDRSVYPEATLYADGVTTVRESIERVFPRANESAKPLFEGNASIFQVHPRYGKGTLLAEGAVKFMSPVAGENMDQVSLIASCGDLRFYLKPFDHCVRISPNMYLFMMAEDCLGLELKNPKEDTVWNFESFLNKNTNFLVEEDPDAMLTAKDFLNIPRDDMYPQDKTSQSIMKMTGWLCHSIVKTGHGTASTVHKYGEKKIAEVPAEAGSEDLPENYAKNAQKARTVTKKMSDVVNKISEKVSHKFGDKVTKHIEVQEGDSDNKMRMRQIAASSLLAYAEVSDAVAQGYVEVVQAGKEEGQAYAEKKYGQNAKETVRHGTATAANVGKTAYATRRIVSVKKIVKSNAKYAAQKGVENYSNKGGKGSAPAGS
ncbi:hypothetical protein NDN08_005906 [Rhodosorus marinus]|uniref:Senescence domain-containing protein n=1 Tax=Rhodosorus marinus TaxID=101924 RepID=A0AAV8V2Y1_9RHOD|nr:hypothetical protein NDN08_005906 [Rhodosorus marinus]